MSARGRQCPVAQQVILVEKQDPFAGSGIKALASSRSFPGFRPIQDADAPVAAVGPLAQDCQGAVRGPRVDGDDLERARIEQQLLDRLGQVRQERLRVPEAENDGEERTRFLARRSLDLTHPEPGSSIDY